MIFKNEVIDFENEPLFYGSGRNISRVDLPLEPFIAKMTKRHLSQIWFPHDIGLKQDAVDYVSMSDNRREFFLKNLKFQTLLDSAAGRGILETLLPVTTSPHLETWFTVHGMFENAIHSDSYAEIIKALGIDSSVVFDDIMVNDHILKRGEDIVSVFNNMHQVAAKWSKKPIVSDRKREVLVETLYMLNILENILFKTSFICSFAFAENGVMEGSAKILQLISQDEILHYGMTVYLLKRLAKDNDYVDIIASKREWAKTMYKRAYEADCEWISYLYETDPGLIGLSENILKTYSLYNIRDTMQKIGLEPIGVEVDNPVPWAKKYMYSGNVQTALNETDGVNYLFGVLDKNIEKW